MVSVLRILWICLLALALPMQGMAAATMAFCGAAGQHPLSGQASASVSAHETGQTARAMGQQQHSPLHQACAAEHGMHHTDHADVAGPDSAQAGDMPVADIAVADIPAAEITPNSQHDAGHTCSACASCCAAAALPVRALKLAALDVSAVQPIAQLVNVHAFATDAPERPPRAMLA